MVDGRHPFRDTQPPRRMNTDRRRHLDTKSKGSPASAASSPGPVVNQLDDNARETFATGRPLQDIPDIQQCKHCKKSVLKTAAKAHIDQCLKLKKEKAQRKKEAREARERAKEAAREEEARKAEEENGEGKDDDSDDGDGSPDKKGKVAKKAAGKKPDDKGKKRKADGTLEGGPKSKKKKDEPKAKAPKTKGTPGPPPLAGLQAHMLTRGARTCRCRTAVWCHPTKRSTLRPIPHL